MDTLLGQAGAGPSAAGEGVGLAASLILGDAVTPALVEGLKRLIDVLLRRHRANVVQVVRVLVEAYGTAYDDTVQRLQADPQLENFVLRVIETASDAANQEKLDYYANLLKGTASPEPPDDIERERLLDTLNNLRRSQLRLFHAIAGTEEVPFEVERKGNVWVTLRHVSGIEPAEAQEAFSDLVRLRLAENSWGSVTNLRLALSEYGLRFEAYVAGRSGRTRPRWEAELVAPQSGLVEELARDFDGSRQPRIVREVGGYYLTAADWDVIDDASEIRNRAAAFVQRMLLLRSIVTPQDPAPTIAVERIHERQGAALVVHPPTEFLDVSGPIADVEFPTWHFLDIAERLMSEDATIERAIRLMADPTWGNLVDCVNLAERNLGYRADQLPQLPGEGLRRFDAEAVGRGLERPSPGEPAQMGLQEATGLVRQVLQSWILVNAGRWRTAGDVP